jgi:hypothetical protein
MYECSTEMVHLFNDLISILLSGFNLMIDEKKNIWNIIFARVDD